MGKGWRSLNMASFTESDAPRRFGNHYSIKTLGKSLSEDFSFNVFISSFTIASSSVVSLLSIALALSSKTIKHSLKRLSF